ncbi:hypothetical protein V6N11_062879 [Hibiscus sabdariffa]|uniref:Uncharacterized protein n=1 Tax=Hibiscus sabdariffa TaxID=183260 RepID=A0ABR2NPI4_9ROSI
MKEQSNVPESNGREGDSKSFVEVGNDPAKEKVSSSDVKTSRKLTSEAWQYFELVMENDMPKKYAQTLEAFNVLAKLDG